MPGPECGCRPIWLPCWPATNLPVVCPSAPPLVAAFSEPGFNLSEALSDAQGQLCSFLSSLDVAALAAMPANISSDVEGQVAAALIRVSMGRTRGRARCAADWL